MAERFLNEEIEPKRRKATVAQYRDLWERLASPKLGKLKVSEVRFRDIADLHYGLRETPIAANRTIAVLSSMFSWSERQGLRDKHSNPAVGIEKFKEQARQRFLSPRELGRLGIALARAERKQTETPWAIAAIRLLIFTGMRRNEVLTLRWQHVNVDKAMLFLPETKTGPRAVYLSAPALAVLASLPRVAKNPYVIVGDRAGQHLVNLTKAMGANMQGRPPPGRPAPRPAAQLRFRSARAAAFRLPIIGRLLGHTQGATTERYSHLSADPVRAANEAMGSQIAAMLHGRKANVVPIDGKRSTG